MDNTGSCPGRRRWRRWWPSTTVIVIVLVSVGAGLLTFGGLPAEVSVQVAAAVLGATEAARRLNAAPAMVRRAWRPGPGR